MSLLSELADASAAFMRAEQDMHRMYGSTAVCYGGIGGAAMTFHCTHSCQNPVAHEKEKNAYREALLTLRELIQRVDKAPLL